MAYVNGNKPIITSGLVYALDFGNLKSYTTGSNTAKSLVFDTAVTAVTGSSGLPTLVNGILNITSSQFIRRTGSIDSIDPNGAFTISLVAKPNTVGSLLTQNLTGKVFQIQSTPSSSNIGFSLGTGTYSRTIPGFNSGSLQHISFRYNSGSIDTFLNGIPVTSSIANTSIFPTGQLNALFFGSGSNSFSGSLANLYVYNRALSPDEIYENYLVMAGRYGLPVVPKPYSIDENLYQWIQATNTTDTNIISAVSTFISGLKSAGLWNKLQVIYPFVETTTGSQTVNLKEPGLYRLGLTGSFSASSAGLYPSSSTSFVDSIPGNTVHPLVNSASAHLSLLSYDLPAGNGFLGGNSLPAAGGDLIIQSGSKMYHIYRNVGSSSFTPLLSNITNVEVLVVAGGGGGGFGIGGGGGAGGLVYSSSFSVTPLTTLPVVVGDGGVGTPATTWHGGFGENSQFGSIVSIGGGGGGGNASERGRPGGSGGGGNYGAVAGLPGAGTPGQGFDGGSGSVAGFLGGGGGGSSEAGRNFDDATRPGYGGSGSYFAQYAGLGLGSPAGWFAGGGGTWSGKPGGLGGGATGPTTEAVAATGSANTGGGGAGGRNSSGRGGAGGSGIVIVSYNFASTSTALTGSGTGLYITETGITGSVNSQFTSGLTGSGNIGFVMASRTQPAVFTLHKNNVSQSVASASLGVLPTDIFFNTANLAGSGSLPLQANLAYASIGAGLTTSEIATYYNLVSQLQNNLKRQNTLLDTYSGAAAAYSLRRIGPSGYFGSAIRVRRDSDNSLRDIGFTSDGQLDTVGLLDFVGVTGSGFVQTWYDQLGANPATMTVARQPTIVDTGSISSTTNSNGLVLLDRISTAITPPSAFNLGSGPVTMLFWIYGNFSGSLPSMFNRAQQGGHGLTTGIPNNGWVQAGYQWDGSQSYFVINGVRYVQNAAGRWIYDYRTIDVPLYINTYPPSPSGQNNNVFSLRSTAGFVSSPNPFTWVGGTNIAFGDAFSNFGGKYFPGSIASIALYNRVLSTSEISDNYNQLIRSTDPDYQAFITATGITEPTQSAALETLVSDLKSYGLWSKMKAIYPMVTDKNNRFAQSEDFSQTWNPVSSSVTVNQITAPNGTSTADLIREITGSNPYQTFTVVNNGASAYTIDGSDNPTLTLERGRTYQFSINASGHPFYIMTGSGAYTVDGQYNTGVTGQGTQTGTLTFAVPNNAPDTLAYVCQIHSTMGGTINVINNTDQHYVYQTVDNLVTGNEYILSIYGRFLNRPWIALQSNDGAQAWFNLQTGVTGSFTGSRVAITPVSGGWYRCALFYTASSNGAKNQHIHLADANGNYSYAGVSGSGSYLWGAQFENGNLLGPYKATTTTGFTTGSILDQMKFNLRNPADTDAAFRLTYSGSWNAGYSGVKSDGTTAWASTKLTPSTNLPLNSTHFSLYLRNTPTGLDYQGSEAGGRFMINYNANTVYSDHYGTSTGRLVTSVASSRGFVLTSRTSTTSHRVYQNQSLINSTTALSDSSAPTTHMYIGGANITGNSNPPLYFSTAPLGFTTLGDGLTDYEAKALYWIVQKFQTTLGRQVY